MLPGVGKRFAGKCFFQSLKFDYMFYSFYIILFILDSWFYITETVFEIVRLYNWLDRVCILRFSDFISKICKKIASTIMYKSYIKR